MTIVEHQNKFCDEIKFCFQATKFVLKLTLKSHLSAARITSDSEMLLRLLAELSYSSRLVSVPAALRLAHLSDFLLHFPAALCLAHL
jgi:hypothetical protein